MLDAFIHDCPTCKGKGNYFQKLYDTAIGGRGVIERKGKIGKWMKCPKCNGRGYFEAKQGPLGNSSIKGF